MKNPELWQPTFVKSDTNGEVCADVRAVYAGSQHISQLQVSAVTPLLREFARGKLLDAGCGKMPYYSVYQPLCAEIYASDLEENHPHADAIHDLSSRWPWPDAKFETILMLDVIAHVSNPFSAMEECARCLFPGGHLILSTPFIYWISSWPVEYYHPTETALRDLCARNGLSVLQLTPFGGYADVLLDTINKGATGSISNRLFRLCKSLVIKTRSYRRSVEKSRYSYPLGYTLVARKA